MFATIQRLGIRTNFKAHSFPIYSPLTTRSNLLARTYSTNMSPRVVVTRRLPPQAQATLEKLDAEIYQWQEDSAIPRDVLLKEIKGKEIMSPVMVSYT
jgi:hypothetical protein